MVRLSGRHTAEVPVFAVLNTVNNDFEKTLSFFHWHILLCEIHIQA